MDREKAGVARALLFCLGDPSLTNQPAPLNFLARSRSDPEVPRIPIVLEDLFDDSVEDQK